MKCAITGEHCLATVAKTRGGPKARVEEARSWQHPRQGLTRAPGLCEARQLAATKLLVSLLDILAWGL